jgi:WhiB family transcriptional regulator, redox-sensing transcriptional regulator
VTRPDRSVIPANAPPRSWLDLAACREVDPEIFFPISTTGAAIGQVREAQAICARCPVTAECLDWAQRMGPDYGVWGGTIPDERRALRRTHDKGWSGDEGTGHRR